MSKYDYEYLVSHTKFFGCFNFIGGMLTSTIDASEGTSGSSKPYGFKDHGEPMAGEREWSHKLPELSKLHEPYFSSELAGFH